MRGGTLFSGIGGPELAAPDIDWRWCAEIDPFASAVLKQRFPHVPNLGDVEKVKWDAVEPVDLLVFGSPCQSFSVAGKRLGLDDPRGNLALVALGVVARLRPRWFVFENVPGLLSSDGGRDFGAFLGAVGELGYGWAYRTLDAQYFGVPQRRRRLFVVGHTGGDWRVAASVLFEPESLSRNPPPSREEGQGAPGKSLCSTDGGIDREDRHTLISAAVTAKWHKGGGPAGDERYNLVAYDVTGTGPNMVSGGRETDIHTALRSRAPGHSEASTTTVIAHSLTAEGFDASEDGTGRGPPIIPLLEVGARTGREGHEDVDGLGVGDAGDPMFTLQGGKQHGIAIPVQNATRGKSQNGLGIGGEAMFTLDGASQHAVAFRENTRAEVKFVENGIAQSLTNGGGKPGQGFPAVMAIADPISANEARTYTHEGSNNFRLRNCVQSPMSFTERTRSDGRNLEAQDDLAYALCNPGSGGRTHSRQLLDSRMAVRRLMPIECERLQGFPDGFTLVTYRSKPAADGPRYRALGNSMCVNEVRWILTRIEMFEGFKRR